MSFDPYVPAHIQYVNQEQTSAQVDIAPSAFVEDALLGHPHFRFDPVLTPQDFAAMRSAAAGQWSDIEDGDLEAALQREALRAALLGGTFERSADRGAQVDPFVGRSPERRAPGTAFDSPPVPAAMIVALSNPIRRSTSYAALRFDAEIPQKDADVSYASAPAIAENARRALAGGEAGIYRTLADRFDAHDFERLVSAVDVVQVRTAPPHLEWCGGVPAIGERCAYEGGTATLGALATVANRLGVLTVAHALPSRGVLRSEVAGAEFDVSQALVDRVWDAAWLPLRDAEAGAGDAATPRLRSARGLQAAPGRGLNATFVVRASSKTAVVDAVDPILPYYQKDLVARMYTNRCTVPGDSGAVLFNGDGCALGLASGRTTEGNVPSFSYWMWMPGVLDALGARLPGDA